MQVLKELAREARFEVEIHAGGGPTGSVTLRAVDVPVERALARLLGSVPYALHYEGGEAGEDARLARVAFGEPGPEGGIAGELEGSREPQPMREDRQTARREWKREPPDPTRLEEMQYEDIRNLEDSRTEVRIDAAESIYPDEEGVAALAEIVTDDPDPAVRVAAAETLGQALEDPNALGALLRALRDPDPEVVIAALDGIGFIGDHTVIPELEFLRDDPNPDVRDARDDTADWLEE
jgi:HEAT repeat protein